MNIGFFTDSYLPSHDGVATAVAISADQLMKLGHNVTIVAPNMPHVRKKKNIYRIISVKLVTTPEVWEAIEIPQLALFELFKKDFDIIHVHSGGIVTNIGWQIAKLHRIPLVMTYHTLWRYYFHYFPFLSLINPWMFKEINFLFDNTLNALIVPTEKVKHILHTYTVKKPIYVIPNGIALDRFMHSEKGYLRKKLQIPRTKTILLTVGRLEKEKSPDFILTAFSHIVKNNPDVVLVFVGEGSQITNLKKHAWRLQIASQIFFTGTIPFVHMPQVYADAEIFLFASKTETQGLVVYEALASGLPVMAVHDAAFSSLLTDGYNGYMTNKNPAQYAKKTLQLLEDKEKYKKISKNAQKSVVPYSIENTVKQLEQCYFSIKKSY